MASSSGDGFQSLRFRQIRTFSSLEERLRVHCPVHLDHAGDQSRPAGLVACPEAGPVVAVEIFIKEDVVLPVWIVLEFIHASIHRPLAVLIAQEYFLQPGRDLPAYLEE